MFSGIKYIFGYTEETVASPTVNDVVTAPTVPRENNGVPAVSADTSTTNLEQTLNSATTKFAEQLLPQQASIEQLQSSSHQLLPSIIEQHEEDELKKKTPTCENAQVSGVGDDEDEDGFNAESWELLDLVEKVAEDEVAPVSLSSSVQKDGSLAQGISKSTSGILKSQNTNDNGTLQARQKPKVSFEAPDLVKFKQGIEQTKSNVAAATATAGSGKASESTEDSRKVVVVKDDVCGQNVPILNYAKALSSKIRADATVKPSGNITAPSAASPSKMVDEEASNLNGPVKRVRPTRVSTSSWSSHDDEDDIEQVHNADWEGFYEKPVKPTQVSAQVVDADDNESVISSDFSDCDFGFGDSNDYVMRPKKANVKRGRSSSSKLGSSSGTKASRSDRKVAKGKLGAAAEAKSDQVPSKSTDAKDHKSETPSSSRNSKPKKKRMIMSTSNKSVNLSDFLKSRPGPSRGGSSGGSSSGSGSKEVGHQVSLKRNNSSGKQQAQRQTTISIGGGSGSTESSDVADMDESWFVTPPSCFTGAVMTVASDRVGGLPKNKEADRENALIEHPSIYIVNTASRSPVKVQDAPTAKPKLAGISNVEVVTSKPNNPASKILEKLEDESWNSGDDDDDEDINFDDDQLMATSKLVEVTEKTGASGSHEVVSITATTAATASEVAAKPTNEMKTTDSTTVSAEVKNKEDGKCVEKPKGKQKSAKTAVTPKRNLGKQKARASSSSTATMKPSENKAWKNKFIVDAWDLDENEDADSDFDNMFESSNKRKSPMKTKKQQQQKQVKLKKVKDEDNMSFGSNEIASYENDSSSSSVELLSVKSLVPQEFENNENLGLSSSSLADNNQETPAQTKQPTAEPSAMKSNAGENRRPPTQVRPIEPERVPSWLLKRQRSKRRPLGTASIVNKQQPQSPTPSAGGVSSFKASSKTKDESLASGSSSSRSTPTLIDRIGCSIVANLTNLTSGLVSSGAMNYCPSSGRSTMIESQEKTVATKSSLNNYAGSHVARKQLSRGSIRRQNICSKQGNSLRRPDRRLKLFATPNGCSINRKVHTSIH